MARLIPVCGHARWVHPANPPQFTLQELQELVRTNAPEGVVEPVFDFKYGSYCLLVNEEGIRYGLPVNESASVLAQRTIRGNAILVAEPEWDWPWIAGSDQNNN